MRKANRVLAGLVAAAILPTANAQSITGNIGFTGEIVVNNSFAYYAAATATNAIAWNGTEVFGFFPNNSSFGSAGITSLESATFAPNWSFDDTTIITNFWKVGGFTFTLDNSIIDPSGTGGNIGNSSIRVDVDGTISGNGYAITPYTGTMTFADPSDGGGPNAFTAQWAFQPVPVPVPEPDPRVLLGAALPALLVFKRKFKA